MSTQKAVNFGGSKADEPWEQAKTTEELRELARQQSKLASDRLMEISWLTEELRTKSMSAAEEMRQSKLAADRLVEIGKLKAELQRARMQIEELGGEERPEHLSMQGLHDQIRMRDSIINCLQQELAMVRADKAAHAAPASVQPLEQSLLRAKARTQVIESGKHVKLPVYSERHHERGEYQRIYNEEENRLKYISALTSSQQPT